MQKMLIIWQDSECKSETKLEMCCFSNDAVFITLRIPDTHLNKQFSVGLRQTVVTLDIVHPEMIQMHQMMITVG